MNDKKKIKRGGEILKETLGNAYFSSLAKKGWEKRRKAMELYKKLK